MDRSALSEIVSVESGPRLIKPLWSPDGAWIAFLSLERSVRRDELVVVRPDGTDRRRLTGGVDRIVGWSGDGIEIGNMVVTDVDAHEAELHVVVLAEGWDRVLPVPADGAEFTWAGGQSGA